MPAPVLRPVPTVPACPWLGHTVAHLAPVLARIRPDAVSTWGLHWPRDQEEKPPPLPAPTPGPRHQLPSDTESRQQMTGSGHY